MNKYKAFRGCTSLHFPGGKLPWKGKFSLKSSGSFCKNRKIALTVVLGAMSGDTYIYHSSNRAIMEGVDNGDFQYCVEYLSSINATGLPISDLKLKIGAPLMILRNLDPTAAQKLAHISKTWVIP